MKHDLEKKERLLCAFNAGKSGADSALIEYHYLSLIVWAKQILFRDRQSRSLEPQDLVTGVFEKLKGKLSLPQGSHKPVEDFEAYARWAMNRFIQERVRYESRLKRGGNQKAISLSRFFEETDGEVNA